MVARLLETCRSLKPSQKSPCHQIVSKKRSASCEEPQRRLLEKLAHHMYWWACSWDTQQEKIQQHFADLGLFETRVCYPNEPRPAISCSCAFIPGCSFIRRKETDQPATTLANEKSRKEYNKTSSIKRIRLCTWSGKNPEKSSAAISFLDYTSDYPPLFKVRKQQRRNWFATPFPGSKTFQLYRSQNRSIPSWDTLTGAALDPFFPLKACGHRQWSKWVLHKSPKREQHICSILLENAQVVYVHSTYMYNMI